MAVVCDVRQMKLCAEYAQANFGDICAPAAQMFFRETVALTSYTAPALPATALSQQDRMRLILVDWLAEGVWHRIHVTSPC